MLEVNKIYHGDSLELINDIPDKSVDMILEDMPYNITACKWDVKIDLEQYWKSRKRIIKDNGVIVLTASQPFTSMLVMSNLKMFKYDWVLDKKSVTNFAAVKYQPLRRHESILVFYNKNTTYNPMMRKETILGNFGKKSTTGGNVCGKLGLNYKTQVGYPVSIIQFRRPNNLDKDGNLHSSQKSVDLFRYLILTYTNENDLIVDGFAGSGTTGVAAIKTNRNFICI